MTAARLIAVCCLLSSSPALAQYRSAYGYTFNNPISASVNTMLWNKINAGLTYRSMLKKRGYTDAQLGKMSTEQMLAVLQGKAAASPGGAARPAAASPGGAARPAAAPATRFQPARRSLLLPAMTKSMLKDPKQQRALLEVLEKGVQEYEVNAKKSGFPHDVAGAMAFFIGASYLVYNQGRSPDDKGLDLVAGALQRTLDTPEMGRVSAADKQRFYELMVGLGTYLAVAYQQAASKGDKAQAAELRDAAGAALKGFLKIDPDKVRITAAGLELAK